MEKDRLGWNLITGQLFLLQVLASSTGSWIVLAVRWGDRVCSQKITTARHSTTSVHTQRSLLFQLAGLVWDVCGTHTVQWTKERAQKDALDHLYPWKNLDYSKYDLKESCNSHVVFISRLMLLNRGEKFSSWTLCVSPWEKTKPPNMRRTEPEEASWPSSSGKKGSCKSTFVWKIL